MACQGHAYCGNTGCNSEWQAFKPILSIKDFIDNQFIARDSRAFKKHVGDVMPDVKLEFTYEGNGRVEEGVTIPVGVSFFWPDA